jgi:hypothetical protein
MVRCVVDSEVSDLFTVKIYKSSLKFSMNKKHFKKHTSKGSRCTSLKLLTLPYCCYLCFVGALRTCRGCSVVLGSPVSRLQKNRDQTGPRPIKTGKMMDQSRPQPRSGLRSIAISDLQRPTKNRFKPVSTGFSVYKFYHK